jgi:hypothetical protein
VPRTATAFLSVALIALGVAMLVVTIVNGGGPLATGVLFGILFAAAGVARLFLDRSHG